jgi:hypothetical protein
MARIRTIKPEFPQSESMGRVSRDARLLFVLLWTVCDDAGRSRGDPRLLKGLLFPYDEVAYSEIEAWLAELEAEGCLTQYAREGSRYLAIRNWLSHQKIDRPSRSRLPEPPETVAKAREDSRDSREASSGDLGPRTGTKDHTGTLASGAEPPSPSPQAASPPTKPARTKTPTKTPYPDDLAWDDKLRQYATERLPDVDVDALIESFRGKALAKGWKFANWRQAAQEYIRNCAPNSGHFAAGQYPRLLAVVHAESPDAPATLPNGDPNPIVVVAGKRVRQYILGPGGQVGTNPEAVRW